MDILKNLRFFFSSSNAPVDPGVLWRQFETDVKGSKKIKSSRYGLSLSQKRIAFRKQVRFVSLFQRLCGNFTFFRIKTQGTYGKMDRFGGNLLPPH